MWALLLVAGNLAAAPLRVEAMRLAPDPAWQRGAAEQEQADASFLLNLPAAEGGALQVVIPHHAPVLKADAETYYANLTKRWQAQYGRDAAIAWSEAGGRKWLTCRRPARDPGVVVFHLSTVYQGRAYSLLVFAPVALRTLPQAALDLAAGARFGADALRWVKVRSYRAQPLGEVLEALVQSDAELHDGASMLTGYGLEYGEASMHWFLEGFRWKGGSERLPFALRGRLQADAPAQVADSAPVTVGLSLEQGALPALAQVRVHDVCAERQALDAALARLDQGARGALQRLLRERPAACPEAAPAQAPQLLRVEPGQSAQQTFAIAMPDALPAEDLERLRQAGLAWVRLVEVSMQTSPEGTRLGDALLQRTGLFFRYEATGEAAATGP